MAHRYSSPHRDLTSRTLAVVMAGGNGTRLGELTRAHAKPALPFGGQYRNIDFTLSNCVNSGIRRIGVLTQYRAHALIRHVQQTWGFLRPELGESVDLWPAQQGASNGWYAGTADAVYQNIEGLLEHASDYVFVLAGDHVYKMDYGAMLEAHVASGADATVACLEVPIAEACGFGVLGIDTHGCVREFQEKPRRPKPVPDRSDIALGSMGIYVFNRDLLIDELIRDADTPNSRRDFGHDILPALCAGGGLYAYRFQGSERTGPAYWRDVGTIDSYWGANMDLLADPAPLDLHDPAWPVWAHQPMRAPVRFGARGCATNAIVAGGARIAGAVRDSVVFADSTIADDAIVERSVVLPGAEIGRACRIRSAVIAAGCRIPDRTVIGEEAPDLPGTLECERSVGGVWLVSPRRVSATRVAKVRAAA
jgi:glucose-1-phosphate adenylyltransferase